jgi:hypothetical protein
MTAHRASPHPSASESEARRRRGGMAEAKETAAMAEGMVAKVEPARNTCIPCWCSLLTLTAMAMPRDQFAAAAVLSRSPSYKQCTHHTLPEHDCSQSPHRPGAFLPASRAQRCYKKCRSRASHHSRQQRCFSRTRCRLRFHLSVFPLAPKEAGMAGVVAHLAGFGKSCRRRSMSALGSGTPQ